MHNSAGSSGVSTLARNVAIVGLGVTALLTLAAVVDQVALHYFADYSASLYGSLDPGPAAMFNYAYAYGALGVVCWLVVLKGIGRRARWVLPFGVVVWIVALGATLYGFTVSEFGGYAFPSVWRVLMLVPSAIGTVAVVAMVRGRSARVQGVTA